MSIYRIKKLPDLSEKDISRFWSKVALTANNDKCWNWAAYLDNKGYGHFSKGATVTYLSTRIAYFIYNKIDPDKLLVCHSCDNPACVNPKHLFLGDQKKNIEDMYSKGRDFKRNGEGHGASKFTNEHVFEMRKMDKEGKSRQEISDKFDVSKSVLCNIINRKAWFHI